MDPRNPLFLKAKSLSRRQEVSCDRFGLLCCGSLLTAVNSFIKLMTQSKCSKIEADPDYLLSTSGSPLVQFFDAHIDGYSPWFHSHPSLQIRARALEAFAPVAKDIPDVFQKADFPDSIAGINRASETLLDTMEIDGLKQGQDIVRRFYYYILVLGEQIASADGLRSENEEHILRSLTQQIKRLSHVADNEKLPAPLHLVFDFFKNKVSTGRRIRVLDFLISVIIQDMEIAPEESELLSEFAEQMNIPEKVYRNRLKHVEERLKSLTS